MLLQYKISDILEESMPHLPSTSMLYSQLKNPTSILFWSIIRCLVGLSICSYLGLHRKLRWVCLTRRLTKAHLISTHLKVNFSIFPDHDEIPGHWYNLAGVVVHTGTAEGGHYYSFIRDRSSKDNNWYLFNDAEVKTFDPMQIAAECFGGEMTVCKLLCIF